MTKNKSWPKDSSYVPPLVLQIQENHRGTWTGFTEGYARLHSLKGKDKDYSPNATTAMGTPALSNLNNTTFQTKKFKATFNRKGFSAPQTVEAMVKCNETDFINRHAYHPPLRQYISLNEHKALAELRNNTQIVIKPADKG